MGQAWIRSYIFSKPTAEEKPRFYCRFYSEDGLLIKTNSLGPRILTKASAEKEILRLSWILDVEKLETVKCDGQDDEQARVERLKAQLFGPFAVSF
jgi:hypothetical protein